MAQFLSSSTPQCVSSSVGRHLSSSMPQRLTVLLHLTEQHYNKSVLFTWPGYCFKVVSFTLSRQLFSQEWPHHLTRQLFVSWIDTYFLITSSFLWPITLARTYNKLTLSGILMVKVFIPCCQIKGCLWSSIGLISATSTLFCNWFRNFTVHWQDKGKSESSQSYRNVTKPTKNAIHF